MDNKILIVIVAYSNSIETCNLIFKLGSIFNIEEISFSIVDNNKYSDIKIYNELVLLNKKGFNICYRHAASNIGFCAGSNLAAEAAINENWIWFLNPDCDIDEIFPRQINIQLNELDIFAPLIYDTSGNMAESFKKTWSSVGVMTYRLGSYKSAVNRFRNNGPKLIEQQPMGWLLGASLFIRTHIFRELNGFDPKFFLCADDTADLLYRASIKGYDAYICPTMKMIHRGGGSTTNVRKTSLGFAYFGHAYFFAKHRKYFQFLIIFLSLSFSSVIKIIYHLFITKNIDAVKAYKYALIGLLLKDAQIKIDHENQN